MRGLTVRQPWAWAIAHAGKTVENRTRSLGPYRGRVLITASLNVDQQAVAVLRLVVPELLPDVAHRGVAVAVADLIDVHRETDGCCAPWGELGAVHHVLAAVTPLPHPFPVVGALELWQVPDKLRDRVLAQIEQVLA